MTSPASYIESLLFKASYFSFSPLFNSKPFILSPIFKASVPVALQSLRNESKFFTSPKSKSPESRTVDGPTRPLLLILGDDLARGIGGLAIAAIALNDGGVDFTDLLRSNPQTCKGIHGDAQRCSRVPERANIRVTLRIVALPNRLDSPIHLHYTRVV